MPTQARLKYRRNRRGAILVLSAFLLIVLATVTALVVDVGFLKVTKTHLQAGADASALAAVSQLADGIGLGASKTPAQAAAAARTMAVQYAGYHRNGDVNSSYADANRDVEVGNAILNSGTWQVQVGVAPYNMVRTTLRRDQVGSTNGDRPLPLFFAGILGRSTGSLRAPGTAAIFGGSTFQIPSGSTLTADILPFAFEKSTWDTIAAGTAPDAYRYNNSTGAITPGQSDGIREVDLYPNDTGAAGNSGTVRIGIGNGTSALGDQIRNGVSASDLSSFGGQLVATESQPLNLPGNPGISAAIKADLEAVVGQPRAIALYTTVSGTGNNAVYTIVKFVPIRILEVKLTGKNKHVWIQPAVLVDPTVVPNPGEPINSETIFGSPVLIQ